MAKPPGTKHSKPRKEPVTIDLDPKDVQRKAGEGAPDQPARSAAAAGSGPARTGSADAPKATASSTPPSAAKTEGKPKEPPASTAAPEAGKAEAPKPEPTKPDTPKSAQASGPKVSTAEPEKPSRAETPPKAGSATGSVPPRSTPPGGTGGPGGGSTPPPGPRPAATAPAGRGSNALLAGVAGGLIALALVAGLQWAGVWPGGTSPRESAEVAELRLEVQELRQALAATATGPEPGELDARIAEAVEASAATLGQRIEALEQAAPGNGEPVDLGPLQARIDELEASIATLGDGAAPEAAVQEVEGRLSDLAQRLDALEAAAPDTATGAAEEQLSEISARIETLEAAGGEADDLAARLASIEEQMAGITSELGERADEPRAALVLAASSLKAAIERGGGFETELEIYAALAPDAEGVAELATHAASGVATNAELIAGLPDAIDRMLIAGRERREADGLLDGLWQSARDLVTVRPVGLVEGDSVEAVVVRLEAAVRAGDHGRAIEEYEALPPAAQAAGVDFMDRVRARHQVDTLVDRALTQALRAS